MAQGKWFDRKFDLGLQQSAFAPILDRLRRTPDRIEAALAGASREKLTRRAGDAWSIQENVGHLLDLESLWEQRLDDFDAGVKVLHPADLENRKTHDANHNARDIDDLLRDFRAARLRIVSRLERMDDSALSRVALHPRLQQPMSVVDLGFFVAEHDDQHVLTMAMLNAECSMLNEG